LRLANNSKSFLQILNKIIKNTTLLSLTENRNQIGTRRFKMTAGDVGVEVKSESVLKASVKYYK